MFTGQTSVDVYWSDLQMYCLLYYVGKRKDWRLHIIIQTVLKHPFTCCFNLIHNMHIVSHADFASNKIFKTNSPNDLLFLNGLIGKMHRNTMFLLTTSTCVIPLLFFSFFSLSLSLSVFVFMLIQKCAHA